jgi:hypothetical protein
METNSRISTLPLFIQQKIYKLLYTDVLKSLLIKSFQIGRQANYLEENGVWNWGNRYIHYSVKNYDCSKWELQGLKEERWHYAYF